MKHYKPKSKIVLDLLLILFIFQISGCSLEDVSEPRDGRALNNRMVIVYSSNYKVSFFGVEKTHSFDINKYSRIYKQLLKDGLLKAEDIYVPSEISRKDILLVHSSEFLESLKDPKTVARYLEAPLVQYFPNWIIEDRVLKPFRYSTGGTLLSAREALKHGISINLGGGFHHAKPYKGEGFCIYADMPIAIRKLQAEGQIKRALVIDLDVHQGNGTAVCLNDDETFTFSMHQGDIYPIPKENSDLDIELDTGTKDKEYLEILSKNLKKLFKKAKPDIVFFQAGCDTLKEDPLASLEMTEEGIARRDEMVIRECVKRMVPVVMTLGGGYSTNAWHAQYASIRNIIQTYGNEPDLNDTKTRTILKNNLYNK